MQVSLETGTRSSYALMIGAEGLVSKVRVRRRLIVENSLRLREIEMAGGSRQEHA
jgi:hypothetical protein